MERRGEILSVNHRELFRLDIWICSVTVLLVILATGCFGSKDEPIGPPVTLKAEFCIEGEATDAILYVKNLTDFKWEGISLSVVRRGTEYKWTKGSPIFLLPESDAPASPSTVSKDWINRDSKHKFKIVRESLRRMNFFNDLEMGNIEITSPGPGIWNGDVNQCESG